MEDLVPAGSRDEQVRALVAKAKSSGQLTVDDVFQAFPNALEDVESFEEPMPRTCRLINADAGWARRVVDLLQNKRGIIMIDIVTGPYPVIAVLQVMDDKTAVLVKEICAMRYIK